MSISVGDQRGAFRMTIRRIPAAAGNDIAGRLIMHVPHPSEPCLHAPLTELHTGTYVVGDGVRWAVAGTPGSTVITADWPDSPSGDLPGTLAVDVTAGDATSLVVTAGAPVPQ